MQRGVSRRTIASASPELQTVFRLMACFPAGYWYMTRVLCDVGFEYEVAAAGLGISSATLRQRVHRIQLKLREVLGDEFQISKRRRVEVTFNAEESGVYRMAAGKGD